MSSTTATDKPKAEPKAKPIFYPSLETLVGDNPPIEGEHVYRVTDATGRAYYVKAISPSQAALSIVSVNRISQKSILYAATQALLNRKTESGE